MDHVYIVIRDDHGPDEITAHHAWPTAEAAEAWAYELRTFLGLSLAAVEVMCLSVGDKYDAPN